MNKLQLCIDCDITDGDLKESLRTALTGLIDQLSGDGVRATANTRSNGKPNGAANGHITPKQIRFLFGLASRVRGYSSEQTRSWVEAEQGKVVDGLSKHEASQLINALQAEGGENDGR